MLPQADNVLPRSYRGRRCDASLSFPSLLGAICKGGWAGTEDRAGNVNAPRDGPCWSREQEQAGGNTARSSGEGRNLQELLDSESPAASQPRLV